MRLAAAPGVAHKPDAVELPAETVAILSDPGAARAGRRPRRRHAVPSRTAGALATATLGRSSSDNAWPAGPRQSGTPWPTAGHLGPPLVWWRGGAAPASGPETSSATPAGPLSCERVRLHAGSAVAKEASGAVVMPVGSIDLAKLSRNPELHSASFTAAVVSGGRRAARTFTGREELGQFLEQVGLAQEHITEALRLLRDGLTTSIPNVRLEDPAIARAGLQTTSGAPARADEGGGGV